MTQSMALLPSKRRKTYAHKVRTGCETCKKRHLKCDESKPSCLRCVKAARSCTYNVPKPRLFEISPDPTPQTILYSPKAHGSQAQPISIPTSLSTFFDPREGATLHYYLHETGPWLTRYTPRNHANFWTSLVPRYARSLPACRHLLMAVVGIEQRFFVLETSTIAARANEIVKHYNAALKELSKSNPHPLDLLLAPLLCWMIELMTNNPSTARMHIDSAQRILDAVIEDAASNGSNYGPGAQPTRHHIIYDNETTVLLPLINTHYSFCRGYSATLAACGGIFDSEPISLIQLMSTRYDPRATAPVPSPSSPPPDNITTPPSTSSYSPYSSDCPSPHTAPTSPRTPHIRTALHTYIRRLDPETGHTPLPPTAALRYLRFWEHATWCRRFSNEEATETVVALSFLLAVVNTLLGAQLGEKHMGVAQRRKTWGVGRAGEREAHGARMQARDGDDPYSQAAAFGYVILRFADLVDSVDEAEWAERENSRSGRSKAHRTMAAADRAGMFEAVRWGLELIERFAVDGNVEREVAGGGGARNKRKARALLERVRAAERRADSGGELRGEEGGSVQEEGDDMEY